MLVESNLYFDLKMTTELPSQLVLTLESQHSGFSSLNSFEPVNTLSFLAKKLTNNRPVNCEP